MLAYSVGYDIDDSLRLSRAGRAVDYHIALSVNPLYHLRLRVVEHFDAVRMLWCGGVRAFLSAALLSQMQQLAHRLVGKLTLFKKGIIVVYGVGERKSSYNRGVSDGQIRLLVGLLEF